MIKQILELGPSIFLPLILIIIGIIIKMPLKKIINTSLTMGIAFIAMDIVLKFLFDNIGPVAINFVNNTGIKLNVIDVGWTPVSAMSWSWEYALIMFPIQIIVNFIMLKFNFTNVLNVDILNIWGKILTAILVSNASNNIYYGFLAAIIQIILELKIAQYFQKRIENISNIPNITCSHCMLFQMAFMKPINDILDKIPFLSTFNTDINSLKEKIGIFADNSVIGFIMGLLLGLSSGYSLINSLVISIKLSTALTLLPIIADLFTVSLTPMAQYIKDFMKEKYSGKDIYISLDWTFLAGQAEIWVVSIFLIPITILLAILFSKLGLSSVLPLAGIINIVVVVPALILTNKNIIKMIILCTIFTPTYLIVSTQFSEIITKGMNFSHRVTYYCLEAPIFRWAITNFFAYKLEGIILSLIFLYLFYKLITNKNIY